MLIRDILELSPIFELRSLLVLSFLKDGKKLFQFVTWVSSFKWNNNSHVFCGREWTAVDITVELSLSYFFLFCRETLIGIASKPLHKTFLILFGVDFSNMSNYEMD